MLQTILRLAFYGILPTEKATGQRRGRGEMYFHQSWPLSFELQTNPAHFWVAAAPAVPKPGARSRVWSEGSALFKGPPLATPVCFGGFPLLKLCSLDSSKFSNFIIIF